MWSLIPSRCLINGLIRVRVGHNTAEHDKCQFFQTKEAFIEQLLGTGPVLGIWYLELVNARKFED